MLILTAKLRILVHSRLHRDADGGMGGCVLVHKSDLFLVAVLVNLKLERHCIGQWGPAHVGVWLHLLLLWLSSHCVLARGDGLDVRGCVSKTTKKTAEVITRAPTSGGRISLGCHSCSPEVL